MRTIFLTISLMITIVAAAIAQLPELQDGLSLKYLAQLPSEPSPHTPVIILLHGYGADERDLFELRNVFPKNFLIISARAPYSLPHSGYQWYELPSNKGQQDAKKNELDNSRSRIVGLIDHVTFKYKADPNEVYLIGFSQGAIMSYEVALTSSTKVKGIGVLSGKLFPATANSLRMTPAMKKLKIFIGHGTADERIPFAEGKNAFDILKEFGLNTDFHPYTGMGHAISKEELNDLVKWLKL
jgi:phospholipase/carboxylesterase